jgi:hypothetical protein
VIFDSGLESKVQPGKLVITDRVHGQQGRPLAHVKLALNDMDKKTMANFMAGARCCHETFNDRLNIFRALMLDTFLHNPDPTSTSMFLKLSVSLSSTELTMAANYLMFNSLLLEYYVKLLLLLEYLVLIVIVDVILSLLL